MSTFPPQYPYQPQQFFYEQSVFEPAHNGVRRSKTPTDSLINHTGLSPGGYSPGPLITTPPPLSRNPSQQPVPLQEQLPEQSFWDNGSFSNSPTSVRTPDNDSFEVEMLDSDMGRFYQQDTNIMSTQSSHNDILAVDSTMYFSDQGTFDVKPQHMYANELSASRGSQHYDGSAIPATIQYTSSTATKHDGSSIARHVSQRELHDSVTTARTMEWPGSFEV